MKKILITGASGGLGFAAAHLLAQKGYTVFALDKNELRADQIHPNIIFINTDISKEESLQQAFQTIKSQTNTLDAIINFAGIMRMGSMIEESGDVMETVLDINVLGMYRINQVFFELILQGKGRILNVSSETGVISPAPFTGFYYVSKHAVEVYSDALRRELQLLNIPVITIRPGAFATSLQQGATGEFERAKEKSKYFKKQLQKGIELAKQEGDARAKNPIELAKRIETAIEAKHPKRVYAININPKLKIMSFLPENWQDFLYKKILS